MEFIITALIVLVLTLIFFWATIEQRLTPRTQMEYHGLGWVNVPQWVYGSEHFDWPGVFKGAGFFATAFGCYWLYELWPSGFVSYLTRIGVFFFLGLAYWYVVRAVEDRFIRPNPDGAFIERGTRKPVGRIVLLVILLASTGAYILLGAPWFPWLDLLAQWGLVE